MIGSEEAANLTDIPNIRQQGTRLGNWLTREQAKELLAVPDRSSMKGKRLRDPGPSGRLRPAPARAGQPIYRRDPAAREPVGDRGPPRQGRPGAHGGGPGVGQAGGERLDACGRYRRRKAAPAGLEEWQSRAREFERLGGVVRGRAVGQGDRHPNASERTICAGPAPSFAARTAAIWSRSSFGSDTLPSRRPNATSDRSRRSP
jgi:hypothetical protein